MIRSFYPTDLLSFLSFSRQASANQAIGHDSVGTINFFSPEVFMEQWLPLRGKRHTWVSTEDDRLSGIASVKLCATPSTWRVDYLQADNEDRCVALLEMVNSAAATHSIRKIQLRLPIFSPFIDGARRAGFWSYVRGYLYRYSGDRVQRTTTPPEPYHFRPRTRGDDYGLFDLYNVTVPQAVRRAEGLTLKEWQGNREHSSWPEQHKEFILYTQDNLVGWLRIDASRGPSCFKITSRELEDDKLTWLINYALVCLNNKSLIFCVVLDFQWQLKRLLVDSGFELVEEYDNLNREIAIRATDPQLVPMQV
jgi:hypothetical protein